MVKFLTFTGKTAGRYFALAALTTTLVACGGGGGGDSTELENGDIDSLDLDGDGIPNGEDFDDDDDGIDDLADPFVDRDGDGFDDIIGAQDLDQDGIVNSEDFDADGDFLADADIDFDTGERLDKFIDLNQDGFDDESGQTEGQSIGVTADMPCGIESGSDSQSANNEWNDNCLVRRSSAGGLFADSLYAVGVQRISWCAGFDGTIPADTVADFAEGEFGPSSEASLKAFQLATSIPNSEPLPAGDEPFAMLVDDGQVGPQTWAKLRKAITRLTLAEFDVNDSVDTVGFDTYGFAAGRCADIPLFYQALTLQEDGINVDLLGWRLARNPPNSGDSVPFSIDAPFNRL